MLSCETCGKCYKQRARLNRHERICSVTQGERRELNEDEPLPTVRDLYEVVLHLVDENNRLKEKVSALTQRQQRAWTLKEAVGDATPCHSFREWCRSLVATEAQFEYLLMHGRTETYVNMVKDLVKMPAEELPLRSFDQRKDTVYAFGDDRTWRIMEGGDWTFLLDTLQKVLTIQSLEWQERTRPTMSEDKFNQLCVENSNKLTRGSDRGDATKVKRAIYAALLER